MVSVRQGWRLSFLTVSCLTEQTLSIFLALPGHKAVDESSVLFCPTPPHHLRQDQAFPSCVQSQRSSLSCPGKQSVVLQGPALCPSYSAGLEPSFATSASHRGLPFCSPGISLSAFLWRPVRAHGHGTASRPRCLWKKKVLRQPRPLSRAWSVFLGWSVQGRKVRGKSGWGYWWNGGILTSYDRPA